MNHLHKLVLYSPAKINLFLHITGKRADGYHDLQTAFHFLDFADTLYFEITQAPGINISGMNLPVTKNIIYKAAIALTPFANITPNIDIHIEKRIPTEAGLGGGSSNAATTLLALNKLWQCGLDPLDLIQLGQKLGADVPIFIHGYSAWAEGIGEQLTSIHIPEKTYLLVKPPVSANTQTFFSHPSLTRDTKKKKIAHFLDTAQRQKFKNDFLPLIKKLYPEINVLINELSLYGQVYLSGSGSSLFLIFDDYSQADQVRLKLPPDYNVVIAKGLNKSPAVTDLNRLN